MLADRHGSAGRCRDPDPEDRRPGGTRQRRHPARCWRPSRDGVSESPPSSSARHRRPRGGAPRYELATQRQWRSLGSSPEATLSRSGDERQLMQIVLNLLLNAEEALAGPAGSATFASTLNRAPGRVSCRWTTGQASPWRLRGGALEPFFTTRSASRRDRAWADGRPGLPRARRTLCLDGHSAGTLAFVADSERGG